MNIENRFHLKFQVIGKYYLTFIIGYVIVIV